jgi:hypothetical protein
MNEGAAQRIGVVSLVQVQPHGLIIDNPGSGPAKHFYDASRRVEVDRLQISKRGIEATLESGERVLDIHHLDHPDKEYDDNDLVCVGFSAHYDAMRREFGGHLVDGVAGENIIVEYAAEVWPENLGESLTIESQDTGETAVLNVVSFAAPCTEFSRYCLQRPHGHVPIPRLREAVKFLGGGRRGFLVLIDAAHQPITVRPGDRVFLDGSSVSRHPDETR